MSKRRQVGQVLSVLSALLLHSNIQGWLVYMNLPYAYWINFQDPMERQHRFGLQFSGVPRTTHHMVNSSDNIQLGVWHTRPAMSSSPKRVVLYLHGNAASRAHSGEVRKYEKLSLPPFNAHVVSFDYRGFGDSTGWPTEKGLYDDAKNVFAWLVETLAVEPQNIVVYGHSLGTGVTVGTVKDLCRDSECPGAIILESPFTSIADVVHGFVPFPGVKRFLDGVLHHPFKSVDQIQHVDCPVFIAHGNRDRIIASSHGYHLYQKRRERDDRVTYVEVADAGHDDVVVFEEFEIQLRKWWNHTVFN